MTHEWINVSQFMKAWWRAGQPYKVPDKNYKEINVDGYIPMFREFVLYRAGQFQVEQITLLPDVAVPPHSHPNIDTYECHVAGSGNAWIEDRQLPYTHDYRKHSPIARRFLIKAGDVHWGIADTVNVVLSFQHWHNLVSPTFITDDWEDG